MNLPVKIYDIPEPIRRANVLHDITSIHEQAAVHNAVNHHATDAAREVVAATIHAPTHPHAIDLQELFINLTAPQVETESTPITMRSVVSGIVAGDNPRLGVEDTDISRDALKYLHPDIVDNTETAEAFKALSGARTDNHLISQGTYARIVTGRASEQAQTAARTTEQLEADRYKTHVALLGSKGRFSSIDEVDAWKDREIAAIPVRGRAASLRHISDLFAYVLNADGQGSIELVSPSAMDLDNIRQGFSAAQARIAELLDDKLTGQQVAAFDCELFDARLTNVFEALVTLLQNHQDTGRIAGSEAAHFARKLERLSNNRRPEANLANHILGLSINTPPGYNSTRQRYRESFTDPYGDVFYNKRQSSSSSSDGTPI